MSGSLFIKNQQRKCSLDARQLRWLIRDLLRDEFHLEDFDLGIYLVRARRMAALNLAHLQHHGSTDVITFDYSEINWPLPKRASRTEESSPPPFLHGEIFICIDDAIAQARQFRTTWQSEIVRYVIHGLLHLCGYDDLNPASRQVMKREENRLLKKLNTPFLRTKPGLARMNRIASARAR